MFSLLFCQALDSLGRIVHYGGAWAKEETSNVYQRGFDLFGITPILQSWMSDAHQSSFKLETVLGVPHMLCFQHFRQHLWEAVLTFDVARRDAFWKLAMKVMKWRGYATDNDLVADISELQRFVSVGTARLQVVLTDLLKHRHQLCMFHVSKVFTMMRVASSIAESTHAAIKGDVKRLLRASNFYETMLHILQLMRIYIDDTVRDLAAFKAKRWTYSPYVHDFIKAAWNNMSRITSTEQLDPTQWRCVEQVPEHKESNSAAYTLPSYTQVHIVTFPEDSHPTCTCPEYTQGLRMCSAVCSVLFKLGRGAEHKSSAMLHDMWLLVNHPLDALVTQAATGISPHATVVRPLAPPKPLTIAPCEILRFAVLTNLVHELVPMSLKSPHFEQFHAMLLQYKQLLVGQSVGHAALFPPQPQISAEQRNAGVVPNAMVFNLSPMCRGSSRTTASASATSATDVNTSASRPSSTGYDPAAKGRVGRASSKDPTKYSLHKRAIEGADVVCDCGGRLVNTKKARYHHWTSSEQHRDWLANRQSTAAEAPHAQTSGATAAAAEAAHAQTAGAIAEHDQSQSEAEDVEGSDDAEEPWERGSSESESESTLDSNSNLCALWEGQGGASSEDDKLIFSEPQQDSYYLQFGDLTRCQYAVKPMERCWVRINGVQRAGVAQQVHSLKVKKNYLRQTMHVVLWYDVVDEGHTSIGCFTSSRVTSRDTGWSLHAVAGENLRWFF